MDLSELDLKYFVDNSRYNCPFCKRNNVVYSMEGNFYFNWSAEKNCYGYLIKCSSCHNISLHLSFSDLRKNQYTSIVSNAYNKFDVEEIDSALIYSRPTSFFILDEKIPNTIRDLIFESEEAVQFNLLVGASACLRKAIYELLKKEKVIVIDEISKRTDYKKSIKGLKEKFNSVSEELFDSLSNIQELVSNPLHEGSWNAWDSKKIKFLIELVKTILVEMYVLPDKKKKRLENLLALKNDFSKSKNENS